MNGPILRRIAKKIEQLLKEVKSTWHHHCLTKKPSRCQVQVTDTFGLEEDVIVSIRCGSVRRMGTGRTGGMVRPRPGYRKSTIFRLFQKSLCGKQHLLLVQSIPRPTPRVKMIAPPDSTVASEAPGAPRVRAVSPLQIPSAAGRRQWLVLLMSENELVVGR